MVPIATGVDDVNAEPKLIDVREVAQLLGVSARQVYRLKDAGAIPHPIKLGGCVRWSRPAILEFIEDRFSNSMQAVSAGR